MAAMVDSGHSPTPKVSISISEPVGAQGMAMGGERNDRRGTKGVQRSSHNGSMFDGNHSHLNGKATSRPPKSSSSFMAPLMEAEESSQWGANFWVTLVEPQTQTPFYACPATGDVSWDPPVGNFVMPPSANGEWWELRDDSRGGLPYYYQTKTNETVWEKPDAFVIPFGILQNTSLGRRLSIVDMRRMSQALDEAMGLSQQSKTKQNSQGDRNVNSQSTILRNGGDETNKRMTFSKSVNGPLMGMANNHNRRSSRYAVRRSISDDRYLSSTTSSSLRDGSSFAHGLHPHTALPPIPGSPYATEASSSPSRKSFSFLPSSNEERKKDKGKERERERLNTTPTPEAQGANNVLEGEGAENSTPRSRSKSSSTYISYRGAPPQSLDAMAELLAHTGNYSNSNSTNNSPTSSLDSSLTHKTAPQPSPSPTRQRQDQNQNKNSSWNVNGKKKWNSPISDMAFSSSTPNLHLDLSNIGGNSTTSRTGSGLSGLFFAASDTIPSTPVSVRSVRTTDGRVNGNMNAMMNGLPPPPSPMRPTTSAPPTTTKKGRSNTILAPRSVGVKGTISTPIMDHEATRNMSPRKACVAGMPILLEPRKDITNTSSFLPPNIVSDNRPVLPDNLVSDIQQFVQSDFARQYFSTHRTGFIFKRRVPVEQLMMWQKLPLSSPLLFLNKSLQKDAVKIFKVIQRLMGDRERDKPVGVRVATQHADNQTASFMSLHNGSTTSLPASSAVLLEEERWLLSEGIAHGELRDEIYCQLVKQLTGNPSMESQFRGWQLLCVLLVTFPPSKNFEAYLRSFIQHRMIQTEGRIDVMAKYCLQRLPIIARKGPKGKPPTISEIETASDAAFNPSTFGESLDAIFRLQERTYPHLKVPLILPFLADGILALGGPKSEGIFRVPGDGDIVSELKNRIEKGYYNLEGIDDPHVLASLLKLWLRELCDPLVPDELYNDCIACANDIDACVGMVSRLPTINRRVVLFIISFLQLFLEEKIQLVTKMTSANLALVMTPNLLRCNSESMSVVFTNAQYEQTFVHNLLVHLKCNNIDPDYTPRHGLGAIPPSPMNNYNKSRNRRLR